MRDDRPRLMGIAAAWVGTLLAAATALAAPAAPPDPAAELKRAEAVVAAHTSADDGFSLDDAHGSPALLEAQWAAARRWTADWLDRHPGATPQQLGAAAKHDAGLDLAELRLDPDSLLVSAQAGELGAAFILRRASQGRYVTAMALDEPGTWGGDGPAVLAAWRSDRASVGCRGKRPRAEWMVCGPLSAALTRLSDEADGSRRFAVTGVYSQEAGATVGVQVSVWRWNGRAAEPLLALAFAQMLDDPIIAKATPGRLVLHAKGDLRRMFSCGACSGRQEEIDIDLPARGARIAGRRSLEPELDLVDALYDRLFRRQPTDDLATPAAAARLAPIVDARLAEARKAGLDPTLGMASWRLTRRDGAETLCLSADDLDAPQLFTIERRGQALKVTAVRDAPDHACDGPDARS